ncbi:hypothetical protein ASC66_13490 [Leifsonia sp. Root4]|uniref:copper resistance CopC family protein n=1 Tax=Leifsonia sp. Root4 TaxID=1736525 RepID=UPI0006F24031|nr:copper resistance CopC family protein [Leifsonia sp. Root4]KQW04741.1 hypothetical protein ASC66_13490 [Leifsonia sp. Root4]
MKLSRSRQRGAGIALASLLLGLLGITVGAAPAFAHDQLAASDPPAGAALESAPEQVSLQFTDNVLTIGAIVVVVDADGTSWADGDAILDGPTVSARLAGDMPVGAYEIRWRVVSADGHPISGVIPFTVGDAVQPVDAPGAAEATEPPAATAAPVAGESPAETGSAMRPILIGGGGAAAALLVLAAVAVWKRRRAPSQPYDHGTPSS